MNPFPQSVTLAVRTHMDAQLSFVNDISKSLFRSFQQICDLNIQLAQTMLEETTLTSHQAIPHTHPIEVLCAASVRTQPTAEKLRAYQEHMSRLGADSQVELARVTEHHVQETSRSAKALADEVQRAVSVETERSIHTHQATMRKFTDSFQTAGAAMRGNGGVASMQAAQGGYQMDGTGSGTEAHDSSSSMHQSAAFQAARKTEASTVPMK